MKRKLTALFLAAVAMTAFESEACTNILVSKGATKDGSTMITYTADSHQLYGCLYFHPAAKYPAGTMMPVYEWDTGKYLGEIAQVPETYSTVGNMNEHQLIITESTFGGRGLGDSTGIIDYGTLIYTTLQRAKTAREAIRVMSDLVNTYGYCSSGESFSIADPNEVWHMELIGKGVKMVNGNNVNKGAVWVALRVPEGYIGMHANQARITTFPLNDPENCLYSPDVISFAKESGFYKGPDKNFNFADAYAPLDFGSLRACEARVWSAFNRVTKGEMEKYLDYAMGYDASKRMPLFVKPAEKLSVKEVAWMLGQARNWLPDAVGGILWFGVDDSGTSCLTPIYTSSTRVPECFREGNGHMTEYSPTSAFWLFNRVANFAYLRYDLISKDIIKVIDELDTRNETEIPAVDAAAMLLYEQNPQLAIDFLTNFSVSTAQNMFERWQQLDQYLLVKYMDGNVKKEKESKFLDNGNGRNIPASPNYPGYNQEWQKAVAGSTGDKLKVVKTKNLPE